VKALVGKYGHPTSQFLTPDGADSALENAYPYDPQKAKSLLAAAGYPDGFTMKVIAQGWMGNLGTPFAQAVAKYLSQVGVTLDITSAATPAQFIAQLANYPAVLAASATQSPTAQTFRVFFSPRGAFNPTTWSDETLNQLYQQGSEANADEATTYWQQINKYVVLHALSLPVAATGPLFFVSKKITGVGATSERPLPVGREWLPNKWLVSSSAPHPVGLPGVAVVVARRAPSRRDGRITRWSGSLHGDSSQRCRCCSSCQPLRSSSFR
jgi:peptide/nickel transport system substrate-binding protein